MTRRIISISYKILTICFLTVGILLNILTTRSIRSILSYYTLQSNIICLIAFVYFTYQEMRKKSYKTTLYYKIKGALMIAIFVTGFIYTIALAPNQFQMTYSQTLSKQIANLLVHAISPIAVILDYFLFDEKGKFKHSDTAFWLVFPLYYVIYVYTYRYLGGEFYNIGGSKKYAYFFLDYEKIGYKGVVKWILLIGICIHMISYLLCYVDCKLSKKD